MKSGQALVVVLLTLAVALTLGLSVVTRTNTEVNVATNQEESQRAFSAAEAGLEEALGANKPAGTYSLGSGVGKTNYTILDKTPLVLASPQEFNFPEPVSAGEAVEVNLAGYTGDQLDVCWTDKDSKLEIVVVYVDQTGNSQIHRNLFNPGYAVVSGACPTDKTYTVHATNVLTGFTGTAKTVRIRPFNSNVSIGVKANASLPAQANLIQSQGTEGRTVRKVEAVERLENPAIFDFALFSGGTIQ